MSFDMTQAEMTKKIEAEGFDCMNCNHRHSGIRLAYICVGCPCPVTEAPTCGICKEFLVNKEWIDDEEYGDVHTDCLGEA